MLNRLLQPIDIATLAGFRILFGILGFADVLGTLIYYHWIKGAYEPAGFQFKYYGFEWARPLSEPWMSLALAGIAVLGLLVALGWNYTKVAPLFALGFTYTFLLEKAHYLNHGYLFCWIAWIMPCLPAHREWSWDARHRPGLRAALAPAWATGLLAFLMGVVYFFGGIAKLNPDWLQAVPLKQWISYRSGLPLIGPLLDWEPTAWFMAYGGLLLDLTVVLFLLYRPPRLWAFGAVLFFHSINLLVFNIGIFPFLSVALTALYFPPSFPRRGLAWLGLRWGWLARQQAKWAALPDNGAEAAGYWQFRQRYAPYILAGLTSIALAHLALPLRHHLLPGDVAWTEEGHRYAWRMMLRSKTGAGHFEVVLPDGGKEKVRPADYLSHRQERKLYTHPDMILQFAHFLRDEYAAQGDTVAVYAHINCRLNYRPHCPYIDPEADLASATWSFWAPSPWILPEADHSAGD
ncbi:HTTM domain-containing protein [Phaeodactylibacter luteus]|uniref:HTTM-like domain-containing protein n=1 Tax=Phaeodactylibacter luteus TaxID=1564516 RepID=A0A5C6RI05_9BACT|nr:HTTM domain-containing protein [Phaeodactylibacter luteus]TXB61743.1 hypothetical protein FRY97_17420 [Phaeodactylibacter luteus]